MGEIGQIARILIREDAQFGNVTLSSIVRDANCEAILAVGDSDLEAALDCLLPPPDLMILPVSTDDDEILETVRKREWLRMVPVLAIGPPGQAGLDLWRLRGFGVVGLIDRRSVEDHVRFRIHEVIEARSHASRHARVSCCFLVDLEASGEVTSEFAVSFSIGGVGLASARALDPNTAVRVRLPVTAVPGGSVEVEGRVVRRLEREDGRYDVGIAFLVLPDGIRDVVAAEVRSLLVAAGSQLAPLVASKVAGQIGACAAPRAAPVAGDPSLRFGPAS